MSNTSDLSFPSQKRGDAEAIRRGTASVAGKPHIDKVIDVINNSPGYTDTVPITLFGITTGEYCIAPVPDRDELVLEIVQYLSGKGYYTERFRAAPLDENGIPGTKAYTHALLISWDRRVLRRGVAPKYYTTRDGLRVPCGGCRKQKTNEVADCSCCSTLEIWLCGQNCMKDRADPCGICTRTKQSKGRPPCTMCPARRIWQLTHQDTADKSEQDVQPSVPVVSPSEKSAAARPQDSSAGAASASYIVEFHGLGVICTYYTQPFIFIQIHE